MKFPKHLESISHTRIYPLFFFIMGSLARLYKLTFYSLTGDEMLTIKHGRWDFITLINRVAYVNIPDADIAPPLYYLVLFTWFRLFGSTDFTGRLLSAFLGIGALVALYYWSKSIFSKNERLIALIIFSIHPFHVWYSQEIRMYALISFLVIGSCFFQLKYLNSMERKDLFIYFFFTLASVFTQYYYFFVLFAQNLCFFIFLIFYHKEDNKRRILFSWLLGQILLATCFLFWLKPFLNDLKVLGTSTGFQYGFSLANIPFTFLKVGFYAVRTYVLANLPLYSVLVAATLFSIIGFYLHYKKEKIVPFKILYLAIVILFPIVSLLSIAAIKRFAFRPHALVLLTPLFSLFIACGISCWTKKIQSVLIVIFLISFSYILITLNFGNEYTKPKIKDACNYIKTKAGKDALIINLPFMLPLPSIVNLPGSYQVWTYYLPEYKNNYLPTGENEIEIIDHIRSKSDKSNDFFVTYHDFIFARPYLNKVLFNLEKDHDIVDKKTFASKIDDFDIIVIRYKKK
ncbi:MAG: glycosyltransferase family 39 protein [Candidatus Coatesbacteria bacterium]|nr:glycosyltransferase family 39 protein [Candidatus Coatesbacteria bacterium]